MTSKAAFLARLRPAPSPAAPDTPPLVRYEPARRGGDGFAEAFTALGGVVHRGGLREGVAAAAAGRSPLLAVEGLDLGADLVWPGCGVAGAARAAVGVVRARAAVAQTGSVVLSAADNRGRAASLLPPVCVFVIDPDTIVDTPGDLLRSLAEPPSQLVLVTGPSRSADIELKLVVGVHGPGEVHAVIVSS
ncbi:MAG: lactate utilization protein C [Acidimicrobiales bacterium]